MMFRQLKVGERLQPFTGTTGQGQAAMLVIAVVDWFAFMEFFLSWERGLLIENYSYLT